jgi:integrase
MNRPREKDRHLPPNVYLRHGAYYYVKGGKWSRLGSSLREALAAYAALHEAVKGSMPELIQEALKHILPRVKPSTRKNYEVAAKKLSKILVEFTPQQVKPKDVAGIKRALADMPNMCNRCLSLLRQVFDYALENEIVDSNPAVGIKRHHERKRTRMLSLDEYQAIYAKAGPRLQVIMDLCIRTGQRINAVLRIHRNDLIEDGIRFPAHKTDSKVTVPWTPELRAVVERAKGLRRNIVALTLLHNKRGKAPDYRSVQDQWQNACEAAGVADAHLHDLRALAATWAKKQGRTHRGGPEFWTAF